MPPERDPAGLPCCLLTRPEPGAAETAERLRRLGWVPVLAPALVLRPRPISPPPAQAILLTSRAAARALRAQFGATPVLAVGEATAAEARAAGATAVLAAAGDAEALLRLAAERLDPAGGPLLLAVGQGYGTALEHGLRAGGFRVLRRVVYAASPAVQLPAPALEALRAGQVSAALFFSPRSAGVILGLLRGSGLEAVATGIRALALSARVASVLGTLAWRDLQVAPRLDQTALLDLLGPPGQQGGPPAR
ncbi:uroporphyrinogen-III synthase [Roseomonas elaeocarpi]|uniref:Uroporphyrinogen-III synthase n=1 Tax=Roseomonas elaeocarpi TaxID=907779 RepID=A0ABV6JU33_9PROT